MSCVCAHLCALDLTIYSKYRIYILKKKTTTKQKSNLIKNEI